MKEIYTNIWFNEETCVGDEDQYAPQTWYFADETGYFNGPFNTMEEAQIALLDYIDSTNAHSDFEDFHWDTPEDDNGPFA